MTFVTNNKEKSIYILARAMIIWTIEPMWVFKSRHKNWARQIIDSKVIKLATI